MGKLERHEKSGIHLTMLEQEVKKNAELRQSAPLSQPGNNASSELPAYLALLDSGTRTLLQSLTRIDPPANSEAGPIGSHINPPPRSDLAPLPGWGLFEVYGDTELVPSEEQQSVAAIAQAVLDHFDRLSVGSDEEDVERSDVDEEEIREPIVVGEFKLDHAQCLTRTNSSQNHHQRQR